MSQLFPLTPKQELFFQDFQKFSETNMVTQSDDYVLFVDRSPDWKIWCKTILPTGDSDGLLKVKFTLPDREQVVDFNPHLNADDVIATTMEVVSFVFKYIK